MKIFETEVILEILKDEYSRQYYHTKDEITKREYLYKKSIYGEQFSGVEKGNKNIKSYIKNNNLENVSWYEKVDFKLYVWFIRNFREREIKYVK